MAPNTRLIDDFIQALGSAWLDEICLKIQQNKEDTSMKKMCYIVSGIALALASAAHAQTAQGWLNQKTMTGNWGGGRLRLENAGITFNGGYVGDFADAAAGGVRTGYGMASQFYGNAKLDTDKLFALPGGTITIGFNQRVGRSTTADYVGNKLSVQEAYGAGETLRLTELSYEQIFPGNFVDAKIGFYPMGNDFASTPLGCDFENVGFCAHPQNLPASTSGWADNPQARWGGRVKLMPAKDIYVETGVYEANPTYTDTGNGLKVSTSGGTGAVFPVEFGYTPSLGGLPGHYKVGAYWDTSNAADVTNSHEIDHGRYGFYALVDQMIMSFDGTSKRGLIAFGQVSYSDPQTSVFQGTWLGALIALGPFASRPADYANIGYVRAVVNQRKLDREEAAGLTDLSTGEGILEAGYGIQATPWLLVHPNVQYVMDPGTFSYKHIKNAWVFGLETKLTF